ncbi:aldo/keto reductase [Streptomyces sp. NPDC050560]|uniref:aldo/keto reductase n=1 Tax=Streptomyces sp. NPDC050560 TaxID=3365630 RepID=UPI0037AA3C9F
MSPLRKLGSSGLEVHPLCLGGNVFGWTADRATSFAVLDAYTEAGGNFVDTADVYTAWIEGNSGGESETVIGEWLAARGNRSDVVVATKAGSHPDYKGLAPDTIRGAVDASLRRLGTDHIDLYYTHRDDESVPVESIVSTLDELVRAGKVRAVAASNISPERLRASLDFAGREGLTPYTVLQPQYNLVARDSYEGPLLDVARDAGLAVAPYFALAAGFLTGKYRPGVTVDSRRSGSAAKLLETERGIRVLDALDAVAKAHGAEPASVALAWLLTRPTVTAPIASARSLAQLPPLLAGVEMTLTADETAALDTASA